MRWGFKPQLTQQEAQIKEWTKQEPRQLKEVAQKIKEEWLERMAEYQQRMNDREYQITQVKERLSCFSIYRA